VTLGINVARELRPLVSPAGCRLSSIRSFNSRKMNFAPESSYVSFNHLIGAGSFGQARFPKALNQQLGV
jgi:hypothetical protein